MNTSTSPAPGWLALAIIGAFLVFFPLLWCSIVWLLSHAGGWSRLAQRHAAGDRFVTGERRGGITGRVGVVNYRNVLTVHLTADGFFLEVMPLFRIAHPRLFIPWSEVCARTPLTVLWWKAERLSIGNPLVATITLPAELLAQR